MTGPSAVPLEDADIAPLAGELARAYRTLAAFYRDQMGMTGPEADTHARGLQHDPEDAAAQLARIQASPPDQVSWFDLNGLAERDPAAMARVWGDIRRAARDELASGHRAAQALDWDGRPWQRARYLAIRDGFRADVRPRAGIEAALVDLVAEAYGDYLETSAQLHMQSSTEAELERHDLARHGKWKPQRIGSAEAMEQTARLADRTHGRLLRTVAALADHRRAGPVYVGQVNIAPKQVNIARLAPADEA